RAPDPGRCDRTRMSALPPGSTIGIIGGGQLGRMLAIAAAQLGYRCHIYAPESDSVAAEVAAQFTCAPYEDWERVRSFGQSVDIVTYEFENLPVDALTPITAVVPVHPGFEALRIAQDRLNEKSFMAERGIATAPWRPVASLGDLEAALAEI